MLALHASFNVFDSCVLTVCIHNILMYCCHAWPFVFIVYTQQWTPSEPNCCLHHNMFCICTNVHYKMPCDKACYTVNVLEMCFHMVKICNVKSQIRLGYWQLLCSAVCDMITSIQNVWTASFKLTYKNSRPPFFIFSSLGRIDLWAKNLISSPKNFY